MEGDGEGEDNTERQETKGNQKNFWRISFFLFPSIIFFIDCIYIFKKKQIVTALYSFLFNKRVIFITFS